MRSPFLFVFRNISEHRERDIINIQTLIAIGGSRKFNANFYGIHRCGNGGNSTIIGKTAIAVYDILLAYLDSQRFCSLVLCV